MVIIRIGFWSCHIFFWSSSFCLFECEPANSILPQNKSINSRLGNICTGIKVLKRFDRVNGRSERTKTIEIDRHIYVNEYIIPPLQSPYSVDYKKNPTWTIRCATNRKDILRSSNLPYSFSFRDLNEPIILRLSHCSRTIWFVAQWKRYFSVNSRYVLRKVPITP